jgi:uncharacterized membrane protein YjgN (DUF898 family)
MANYQNYPQSWPQSDGPVDLGPGRYVAQPGYPPAPMAPGRPGFVFDGGAATYLGTGLLASLVTVLTLGIAYPYALCLMQRWRCKHTIVDGRRLIFTGRGADLFGHWCLWMLLLIVTVGIYSFWLVPAKTRCVVEHQAFATM